MRPFPPLGPLYIAAALEASGHDVRFYDATFERDLSGFGRILDSWKPAMAGVYSTFLSQKGALRLGDIARARGVYSVAGGPQASSSPEQYLDGHFDAVAEGEGERTAVELAAALEKRGDPGGIPGLAVPRNGRIVSGGSRPRIPELDSIPFPLRRIVENESYRRAWKARHGYFAMNIMASRGCPFGCGFCSRPVFGRSHRARSVENVMEEIAGVVERYRPERIRFSDDILPLDRKWTLELCGAIQKSGLDVGFECLARTDLMDQELLSGMARAGFRKLYYGVESGSQKVLDAMGKGTRVEDIRRVSRLTREAGMEQHWFMMLGHPGESQADVEKTLALMAACRPDEFSTTLARPMKGTPLHSRYHDDFVGRALGRRARYLWNGFRMRLEMRMARRPGPPNPVEKGAAGVLRLVSGAMAGRGT